MKGRLKIPCKSPADPLQAQNPLQAMLACLDNSESLASTIHGKLSYTLDILEVCRAATPDQVIAIISVAIRQP